MPRGPFVIVLVAVLLAGCAESPSTPNAADGPAEPDPLAPSVEFSSTTGAIRGVVVDEYLMPVPHAWIRLSLGGTDTSVVLETNATGAGEFVFSNLAPATYRIEVDGGEQGTGAVLVDVRADAVAEARITVAAEPSQLPYVQTFTRRGFIGLNWRVTSASGTLGSRIDPASERYYFYLNFTDGFQGNVAAYQWRPTTAIGSGRLTASTSTLYEDKSIRNTSTGYSPVIVRVFVEPEHEVDTWPKGQRQFYHGLNTPAWDIARPTEDAYSVVYQQPFEAFIAYFYHQPPPADYSGLPDG